MDVDLDADVVWMRRKLGGRSFQGRDRKTVLLLASTLALTVEVGTVLHSWSRILSA